MTTDRVDSGRAVYARNFGVDEAEAERMLTTRVGADFTRETFNAAGGLGWHSASLTDRDRSIAVVAALVAQKVTDQRIVTCLTLARRNGVDHTGLTALIVLPTAYVGQPYTFAAMETVQRSGEMRATVRHDRRTRCPATCLTYDNCTGRAPGRVVRAMSAVRPWRGRSAESSPVTGRVIPPHYNRPNVGSLGECGARYCYRAGIPFPQTAI